APIDLLSFISLHKQDWQQHSYLTLNGVSDKSIQYTLESYKHLRIPILCLDNDKAGIAATDRITEKLKQLGYENVSQLLPVCKDWNAQLLHDRGFRQEPAQSHEPMMMDMGLGL
ncbi:toprim domain-containing protein, partial [Ruminococcaceae bacterium OttesenSCG-928-L11]|nr:toprim domain-containing protein [Ruminococcaceae bacterium OttesenSCG-928-L11]